MRIAVTGAAGGIGRQVVKQLIVSGHEVAAAVRSTEQERLVESLGARALRADLTDPASLAALVEGAEVVVHLAAWMGRPAGMARRVNDRGTRDLAAAAVTAGARRLVVASSIAVYGPVVDGVVTEERTPAPGSDAYAVSKAAGEQAAADAVRGTGTELAVLRPTMVFGPDSNSWTLAPVTAMRRGMPVMLGDGSSVLDAVYVEDAARAFALAATTRSRLEGAFNIVGHAVSSRAFFGAYARILGTPLRRVPAGLARAGGSLAATITSALPGVEQFDPATLTVLLSRARFDGSRAKLAFGYEPQVGFEDGMTRTAAWLRTEGLAGGPRAALVVGAAAGLGRAVAVELTSRFVAVHGADRVEASEPIDAPPGSYTHHLVDATDEAALRDLAQRLDGDPGAGLDLLVTTVGALQPGALEAQEAGRIQDQFASNALAPLLAVRAVTPGMRRRGRGRIVIVSSTNAVLVTPFMGAYSAAKAALEMLADALRLELRPFGIEVSVVRPGAMRTGFAVKAREALAREAEREGEPWAAYLTRLSSSSLWGERSAVPVESVARVVARVAFARRAPAKVAGTPEVPLLGVFARLPDSVKDRPFIGALGLGRPRGPG